MPTAPFSYAALQVGGADAAAFLQAQLTVDVNPLGPERHALAAWCDAKGRTLCTVHVVPVEDRYLLLLPAALTEPISRRLRMFVLRARVEITDATPAWAIGGLTPAAADGAPLPGHGKASQNERGILLGLNTGGGPGALQLSRGETSDIGLPVDDNAWQLAATDAGLPEVTEATAGLFVPQMLNLHWLGAVDFSKGCYPGQEVVARLQYRGRLTRRMFRLHWRGGQPQAGDDVVDDSGAKQGTVIRAAQSGAGAGRLLAVLRLDARDRALATSDARLELLELPYATDEQAMAGADS